MLETVKVRCLQFCWYEQAGFSSGVNQLTLLSLILKVLYKVKFILNSKFMLLFALGLCDRVPPLHELWMTVICKPSD